MTIAITAGPASVGSGLPPIIGNSLAMKHAVHTARRLATTTLPMVFVGATGTGKELFAQHVHAWSGRAGRFIPINCGALPRDLIEGMLFGTRRGVFTGAIDAPGMFEAAHRGSAFLDELDSLPMEGQTKLLRMLEETLVWRLGESSGRPIDVRFLGAAQQDLRIAVEHGALRRDFYQRLVSGLVVLPPLVERGEDLAVLALHFAAQARRRLGRDGARVLAQYDWPGNVRELHGVIERAAALSDDVLLSAGVLCEAIDAVAVTTTPASATSREDIEREAGRHELLEVGVASRWDALTMAATLGIRRSALYHRLKRFGLSLRDLRKSRNCKSALET